MNDGDMTLRQYRTEYYAKNKEKWRSYQATRKKKAQQMRADVVGHQRAIDSCMKQILAVLDRSGD